MRFEGNLKVWHVERGYGAVMPDQGGQELFIHVSAFPAEGPQPVEGERLSFEVVTGRNNQKQASRVQRLKAGTVMSAAMAPSRVRGRRTAAKPQRPVLVYALVVMALAAGVVSWLEFGHGDGWHMARLVSSTSTLR